MPESIPKKIILMTTISGHLVGFQNEDSLDEYIEEMERGEAEELVFSSARQETDQRLIQRLWDNGMLY